MPLNFPLLCELREIGGRALLYDIDNFKQLAGDGAQAADEGGVEHDAGFVCFLLTEFAGLDLSRAFVDTFAAQCGLRAVFAVGQIEIDVAAGGAQDADNDVDKGTAGVVEGRRRLAQHHALSRDLRGHEHGHALRNLQAMGC